MTGRAESRHASVLVTHCRDCHRCEPKECPGEETRMSSENRTPRNPGRVGNADARPRTMRREVIKVASISARHRQARARQRCGRLCRERSYPAREGDTPTGRLGTAINPVEHAPPCRRETPAGSSSRGTPPDVYTLCPTSGDVCIWEDGCCAT